MLRGAISALLDPVPDLHLDPTAPEPVTKGVAFRSPAALPVEFAPGVVAASALVFRGTCTMK
jgi:hypothetical protein